MSNTIPCPNPICTHAFTQAELQSVAQLLCPKCGFRMQGKGASKPKTAAPAKPIPTAAKAAKPTTVPAKPIVAQPVPASPAKVVMATPVKAAPAPIVAAVVVESAPASPPAQPAAEESLADGTYFNPPIATESVPLVRAGGKREGKFNWTRFALILLAIGFAICIAAGIGGSAYLLFKRADPTNGGNSLSADDVVHTGNIKDAKGVSEKIYRLVLNKKEWSVDNEVNAKLKAHTTWKHNQYDFWFALVAKDHAVYKPRDADMLGFALEKLESQFGDALELGARAEPAKVGDLPAQKIQFKGQTKAVHWLGECYMFFKDGVAFYLFLASPDWSVVQKFATDLPEKHFNVLVERRGWREQPIPMTTIASLNGKLTLALPKDVWERANPKDEDESGELFAVGKFRKENDNRKNASMLIFTIPMKEDLKDAMKSARDYIDNKIKNDMTNFKIVHAPEVSEGQPDSGTVENVGNRRGRIVDLKKLFNEEAKRYYLMAVVNEPDLAYVILCECTWESRQVWRQDFLENLRNLQFKKVE